MIIIGTQFIEKSRQLSPKRNIFKQKLINFSETNPDKVVYNEVSIKQKNMTNFFSDHALIEGDFTLNQIRVEEEIGRGNSHVFSIYLADKKYAMKQIQIKNDYEYQSFLKQISLMKETSEINSAMIKYYGYFVTSWSINPFSKRKYAHIIMQCADMNLQNLIYLKMEEQKKYFTKNQILTLTEFMINAFQKLQKNKIAHCDIKPENILVLNKKTLLMKICDVGSCRVINSQNIQEATIFGTVPFLAPELIHTKSKKIVSTNAFKSDVYSFGLVLLYAILFKKFSFKERKEVDENAYFQIITQWIREAIQLMNHDSRISEILKHSLEFDEYKRPLFKQLKQIYEVEKKRKRNLYENKLKKMMDQDLANKKATEQTFRSTPVGKLSLFKSRNLNTKISSRTAGIDFPKISRKDSVGLSPKSPLRSPLSKRKSSCMSSSPQKQRLNASILDYKKIIYVTSVQGELIPYQYISQEQKNFVLFSSQVGFKTAESVTIYPQCSMSVLYHLADVQCQKLYFQYSGTECVSVGQDVPLLRFKKVYLNFSDCLFIGGYHYLFRSLCGIQLQYFDLTLNNSDVTMKQVSDLLDKLNNRALKCFKLIWQNMIMSPEEHLMITQKISRFSIKKLVMVMNRNFIKYEKQSRWLLPKNLQILYLEFETNFLQNVINNLCISMQERPIKELLLNFSNNNISKGLGNYIVKTISGMKTLQKIMLNISMNPIEDISYIVSALLDLKTLTSLQLKLFSCNIEPAAFFEAISELKYLFDQKLKILKLAYDRNMKKSQLVFNIQSALEGFKGLRLDVIGIDNKFFMVYIKKRERSNKKAPPVSHKEKQPSLTIKAHKQKEREIKAQNLKMGCCTSLINSQETYQNFLCIGCCQFRQLSKREYFCKFCIENCGHKGHNIVKTYQRKRCCCAYSGNCNTTQLTKKICAQDLGIKIKKEYQCDKCQKRFCNGCISKCMDRHKDWLTESKEPIYFECGSSL